MVQRGHKEVESCSAAGFAGNMAQCAGTGCNEFGTVVCSHAAGDCCNSHVRQEDGFCQHGCSNEAAASINSSVSHDASQSSHCCHHHYDYSSSSNTSCCSRDSDEKCGPSQAQHCTSADASCNPHPVCGSDCDCEKLHQQLQHFAQHQGRQQHSTRQAGGLQQTISSLVRGSSIGPVTTRIHAAGICCPMESRLIHSILDDIPGVHSVDVTVVTKIVTVSHEPHAISPAALVAALNSAGLQASLSGRHCSQAGSESGPKQPQHGLWDHIAELQRHGTLPPLTVLCSGLLLVLSLLLLLPGLPQVAVLQQGLLALVAAAVGIPPVLRKAWAGLQNRTLDMNCLVVVALAGAIGLSEWFEAGALVFLFTLAEWLEERCVSRAAGALEDILRLQPETALVIVEEQGPASNQLKRGVLDEADHSCCSKHCCASEQQDEHQHLQHGHGHQTEHGHIAGEQQQQHCCSSSACIVATRSAMAVEGDSCGGACSPTAAKNAPSCCSTGCCSSTDLSHTHAHPHSEHAKKQQQHTQLLPMPVTQLQTGVLVLVRPGDKVPVDGTIEAGSSVLDESMVTGESKPVAKAVGEIVLAGTVNSGSAALKVRATAAAADSTVARLARLMEAAAASKSRHDKAVEAFAKYYTPAVVIAALSTVCLGAAMQPAEWRHWAYMSLVVLVTGCPCALVISTPVASVAGLTRAARQGVLIKGGRYLELLGSMTAASFDKSGTLTEGHFQLTQLHTFGKCTQHQALQLAAVLEQHSNHPIAHAIVGAAAAHGCISAAGHGQVATAVTEVAGKGVVGKVDGKTVAVGSWSFAQELIASNSHTCSSSSSSSSTRMLCKQCTSDTQENCPAGSQDTSLEDAGSTCRQHADDSTAAVSQLMAAANSQGSTAVCVVFDGQVGAVLMLSDKPRQDAMQALQELRQLNVQCFMLTGDNMGAAAHVAQELGMEVSDVCAQLLPQDKLKMLEIIRRRLAGSNKYRARQQGRCNNRWQDTSSRSTSSWLQQLWSGKTSSSSSSECGSCTPEGCKCATVRKGQGCSGNSSSCAGGACTAEQLASSSAAVCHAATVGPKQRSVSGTKVCIAHVGDGINDAPALAAADVGIAMGVAGAALAVDAADVALFSNNLTSLPFCIRLGRRATWIVAFNTVFACSVKIAVLGAAAAGAASLWLSLIADVGSSLLVTLHALTLLRFEAGYDDASSRQVTSRASSFVTQHAPVAGADGVASSNSSASVGTQHVLRHKCCSSSHCSDCHGSSSDNNSWWQQLLVYLPGSSWLMRYEKLEDHSAAVSAAASSAASRQHSSCGDNCSTRSVALTQGSSSRPAADCAATVAPAKAGRKLPLHNGRCCGGSSKRLSMDVVGSQQEQPHHEHGGACCKQRGHDHQQQQLQQHDHKRTVECCGHHHHHGHIQEQQQPQLVQEATHSSCKDKHHEHDHDKQLQHDHCCRVKEAALLTGGKARLVESDGSDSDVEHVMHGYDSTDTAEVESIAAAAGIRAVDACLAHFNVAGGIDGRTPVAHFVMEDD